MKTGYSIRTWRMRLFCPHQDWLVKTETYYREVLNFYYMLLRQREELWSKSLFQVQRELEKLTVTSKDGIQPEYPLPFGKVPVYFRRSAINKAAATIKGLASKTKEDKRISAGADAKESSETIKTPQYPDKIMGNVTFFKGMYQDLSQGGITLKLWNGEKWVWTECTLSGREFPQNGTLLSPTLVCGGNWPMLNIPVKQENADARTAKERMTAGTKICSVRFTNTDIFAMCCILDEDGRQVTTHTCTGGDAYRHYCRQLLSKIEKSRVYTDRDSTVQPNKKYYVHLKNLSEHYAHQVSREIIDFCLREQAGIVILPLYNKDLSKMSMYKSGNFSPLHLSNRIRSFLEYKAWAAGLLILEVRADGISSRCSVCGGKVKKNGKLFQCENGHEGNRFLNEAKNLGIKCQESFLKNREKK